MEQYAAVFGRLHPLVLHLPIGLVVGIAVLELVALFRGKRGSAAPPSLLWLNAGVALVAALSGLKLSQEDGYGGLTLTIHLWLGIAVAVLAVGVAVVRSMLSEASPRTLVAYRALLAGVVVLVIFAGHFGAVMTHGADFVLAPLRSEPAGGGVAEGEVVEVNFSEFGPVSERGFAHIAPILNQRCAACHSGSRAEGGLVLESFELAMRGSELGPVLLPAEPASSELLRRIELPPDDPDHMPPSNRQQLSPDQVAVLRAWVLGQNVKGADPSRSSGGAATLADAGEPGVAAPEPESLATLRATLAHVTPVSADSNLLWIDMSFAQPALDEAQIISLLRPLAANIEELSLARCAVTDEIAALVAEMPNLRRLNLHETPVTDATVAALARNAQLRELVLTQTAVTDQSIEPLLAMPALSRLYLWGSAISPDGAQQMRAVRPELVADVGEFADAEELLAEADPKFVDAGPKPGAAGAPVALTPVNAVCPVSGAAVSPKYLVVHEGKVIGFCCPDCPKQFWADPAKFAEKLKQ
jgi:uncharacterized membrane protein